MAAQPLPTPRALLTSLFNTLPTNEPHDKASKDANTILSALHPASRPLLTTLHVLYPGLLLPALDLLDRGLVTHVSLPRDTNEADTTQVLPVSQHDSSTRHDHSTHSQAPAPNVTETDQELHIPDLYIVRSSQEFRSKGRFSDINSTSQSYNVRLAAWNCTCAAFAFSAFSGPASSQWRDGNPVRLRGQSQTSDDRQYGWNAKGNRDDELWEFGGMSLNGANGGGVPCCKHLLAVVLSVRWKHAFASHVKERRVGREELAGLGADG